MRNFGYFLLAGMLILAIFSLLNGCSSPLADASFQVQQEFHHAVTTFGVVALNFSDKATKMADAKHRIQRKLQAVELATAYTRAQDADGNLVLTPAEFAELTSVIIEGQHAVVTSESRWASVRDKFAETTHLLGTVNISTLTTAKAIHEMEKSIKAFTNQVVQAIGGIIAASGFAF